jgi:hypothetical protein
VYLDWATARGRMLCSRARQLAYEWIAPTPRACGGPALEDARQARASGTVVEHVAGVPGRSRFDRVARGSSSPSRTRST